MPDANMSIEKRENPRVSVKIPIKYRLVNDQEELKDIQDWRKAEKNAFTLDVSMGGMHIVIDHQPLTVGNIMKFSVFLLDKKNIVSVYAEVMWVKEANAGLRFLMMKNDDTEALKTFLANSSNS